MNIQQEMGLRYGPAASYDGLSRLGYYAPQLQAAVRRARVVRPAAQAPVVATGATPEQAVEKAQAVAFLDREIMGYKLSTVLIVSAIAYLVLGRRRSS